MIQLTVHWLNMIICEYLRVSKLLSVLSLDSHPLHLRGIRVLCVEFRVAREKVSSKCDVTFEQHCLCTYMTGFAKTLHLHTSDFSALVTHNSRTIKDIAVKFLHAMIGQY